MRELLAEGLLAEADPAAGREGIALYRVQLLAPIPDPDKIVCIGLNYRSHAEEAGIDPPQPPTFFAKFRNALAPTAPPSPYPASARRSTTRRRWLS